MERLKNLSGINTNTIEGRLLIAALAQISIESQQDKEPDTILQMVHDRAEYIYKDIELPSSEPTAPLSFEEELSSIINQRSIENKSDTPDYILAQYLSSCLAAYERCVQSRDTWFNVDMWINRDTL